MGEMDVGRCKNCLFGDKCASRTGCCGFYCPLEEADIDELIYSETEDDRDEYRKAFFEYCGYPYY